MTPALDDYLGGLHFRVEGSETAPPVVLSHAISTSLALWDLQVPVWSQTFRVIRYDARGHGGSRPAGGSYGFEQMADDVLGLLDHLGLAKVAFVGLSLGGMVGQALALRAPDRLSALVLAHTNAKTPANLEDMWVQRAKSIEANGVEPHVDATLARWFTAEFRAAAPLTVAWIANLIRATDAGTYVQCCRAIQKLDFFDRLNQVRVPTLTVAGAEDMGAPPANLEAMASRIPGAQCIVIDRGAHLANVEQSHVFTERVGAFLKRQLLP